MQNIRTKKYNRSLNRRDGDYVPFSGNAISRVVENDLFETPTQNI